MRKSQARRPTLGISGCPNRDMVASAACGVKVGPSLTQAFANCQKFGVEKSSAVHLQEVRLRSKQEALKRLTE